MGYAAYVLPDGTEAGYAVEAPCDASGCDTLVWRGMDALCGDHPGENKPGDSGCGLWFCTVHQWYGDHDCDYPACGMWDEDEMQSCHLIDGHKGAHRDMDGAAFEVHFDRDGEPLEA